MRSVWNNLWTQECVLLPHLLLVNNRAETFGDADVDGADPMIPLSAVLAASANPRKHVLITLQKMVTGDAAFFAPRLLATTASLPRAEVLQNHSCLSFFPICNLCTIQPQNHELDETFCKWNMVKRNNLLPPIIPILCSFSCIRMEVKILSLGSDCLHLYLVSAISVLPSSFYLALHVLFFLCIKWE